MNVRSLKTVLVALLLASVGNAQAALVEVWSGAVTDLTQADAVISSRGADATANFGVIDFTDGGDANAGGTQTIDNLFPGGFLDHFVVRVTGTVNGSDIPFGDFFIVHDDGMRFSVNGVVQALFAGITDNRITFARVPLLAGLNIIEIVYFEYVNGATLELLSRNPANTGVAVLTSVGDPIAPTEVQAPGAFALVAMWLLGGVASRRQPGGQLAGRGG